MDNVLIQCGDHHENQSRILPLALHLREKGYNPVLLQYNRNNCSRVFEYEGFDSLYLDDYRKKRDGNAPVLQSKVFNDVVSVERSKAPWKFSGHRLEKQKLTVARDYYAIEDVLNDTAYSVIGVWNGYTGYVANILRYLAVQNSANRFFMERSFFPGSLFVDTDGVNGASSISTLRSLPSLEGNDDSIQFPVEHDIEGSAVENFRIQNTGSLVIFLPLQVQTDTNNILYSPHISSMRHLILLVLDGIKQLESRHKVPIKVVVRQHPEEVDKKLNLPCDKHLFYSTEGEIADWCAGSDVVVTINSTVGLEAVALGASVVVTGTSIYSGKGLVLEANRDNLAGKLENILFNGWVPDPGAIKSYFNLLWTENTCNGSVFPRQLARNLGASVDHNTVTSKRQRVHKQLSEKFESKSEISVGVYADTLPTINQTYRKHSVPFDSNYIKSKIRTELQLRDSAAVRIKKIESILEKGPFDIVIVGSTMKGSQVDFGCPIFDEYLLPLSLNKRTPRKEGVKPIGV